MNSSHYIAQGMNIAATIIEKRIGPLTREECDGCGNYDDYADGCTNDTLRAIVNDLRSYAAEYVRTQTGGALP